MTETGVGQAIITGAMIDVKSDGTTGGMSEQGPEMGFARKQADLMSKYCLAVPGFTANFFEQEQGRRIEAAVGTPGRYSFKSVR